MLTLRNSGIKTSGNKTSFYNYLKILEYYKSLKKIINEQEKRKVLSIP